MKSVAKANVGAPTILSVDDLSYVEDEPRILDTCLAKALGFHRSADIRPLIARHEEALNRFGPIIRTIRKNQGRGRPALEAYLNKRQALYICTKAETTWATEVTIQMVEVFDAFTSGSSEMMPTLRDCIHPDTPVTYGELLEVLKSAIRKQFGDSPASNRFEANLIESLEEVMGNPGQACTEAQTQEKPLHGRSREGRSTVSSPLPAIPSL
jgi:hypothetical protein